MTRPTSHPLAILVDGKPRFCRIGGGAEYVEDAVLEALYFAAQKRRLEQQKERRLEHQEAEKS